MFAFLFPIIDRSSPPLPGGVPLMFPSTEHEVRRLSSVTWSMNSIVREESNSYPHDNDDTFLFYIFLQFKSYWGIREIFLIKTRPNAM